MYQKYAYLHIPVNRTVPTISLSTYTVSQHLQCHLNIELSTTLLMIILSTHLGSQHSTWNICIHIFMFTAQYSYYSCLHTQVHNTLPSYSQLQIQVHSTVLRIFVSIYLHSQYSIHNILIYTSRFTAHYLHCSYLWN